LPGHGTSASVVALEPHSASSSEVSTVIAKRARAREQLRAHLKENVVVSRWYWVASGRVDFVPFDKQMRRLEQAGITFVGKQLQAKHLLASIAAGTPTCVARA
jgi:hypothetical protein